MTRKKEKEKIGTFEPLDFINKLSDDELKEFIETIDRYMELRKIVDFLEQFYTSSHLTHKEKQMLESDRLHFCEVSNYLYKRLGYWLV